MVTLLSQQIFADRHLNGYYCQAGSDTVLLPSRKWQFYSNSSKHSLPFSELLRSVRWFNTTVSGLPIGPIHSLALEDGTNSPETSVSTHLTLRNIPIDGRLHFNRGGSLTSCWVANVLPLSQGRSNEGCKISGFHRSTVEAFLLLGSYETSVSA
jgi:hypothetical protein